MRNPNSLEEVAEIHSLLEDIKKEYTQGIRGVLKKNDPNLFRNVHTIPKLQKIQINRGLGLAAQNTNILKKSIQEFTSITGQKPLITRSKKAIAGFKIREGYPIGCKVTLRREKMYDFIERLVSIAIPRMRDFRGLNPKSFDGRGNFSMGLTEQIVFAEIDYDKIDKIRGLDICVTTTAKTNEEALELLKAFKFPFRT